MAFEVIAHIGSDYQVVVIIKIEDDALKIFSYQVSKLISCGPKMNNALTNEI